MYRLSLLFPLLLLFYHRRGCHWRDLLGCHTAVAAQQKRRALVRCLPLLSLLLHPLSFGLRDAPAAAPLVVVLLSAVAIVVVDDAERRHHFSWVCQLVKYLDGLRRQEKWGVSPS